MTNKAVNAGTDAQTGFALQRNTALYLLLNDYYSKFKDKKYFICLEHHDDFLFCFLDENDNAKSIEAYQSKKKSPDKWTLNSDLYEIISKLLNTGTQLIKDEISNNKDYKHSLHFSTNQTILLKEKVSKKSITIKEDNCLVAFIDLDDELKDKIKEGVRDLSLHDELENLHFFWIDLNRTVSKQENELVGQLESVFKNSIINHRAAVNTLISLFRKIEETYSQGNQAKLLDETKRVSGKTIENALEIITTKSKAFDYWRSEEDNLSNILKIKPFERDSFKLKFESAFDLFKSFEESEHQKIYNFVQENYKNCQTYTPKDNMVELYDDFVNMNTHKFPELDLKAIIYAAYFEATLKQQNKL